MADEPAVVEEKPKPSRPSFSKKGGSSTLIMALSVVNLLANVGMISIIYISFQKEKQKQTIDDINAQAKEAGGAESEKRTAIEFGKMVTLEQFTVNLSTPGSVNPKFARVNISFEVPTEIAVNEVNVKMPQVRNTIIDLFNSKRPSDLATVDGREYLKEEIKNAVNSFMVSGKVKGVFFTSFAISG